MKDISWGFHERISWVEIWTEYMVTLGSDFREPQTRIELVYSTGRTGRWQLNVQFAARERRLSKDGISSRIFDISRKLS